MKFFPVEDLLIRDVADQDMEAIQRIYAEQVLRGVSSWEEEPPSLDEMFHRRNAIVQNGYPYLVAERGKDIVGYTYASSYRERVGYRYTVENTIYVDKSMRSRGVGKQLLEELINHCVAMGYRQMVAVIGDSNNQASINFHNRMGFIHAGRIQSIGFKFDRWMDSIIMQRPLGLGDKEPPSR